ncbi:fructose-1,6-bisphosphatase [archaeon]|nr:fructose-1,6-bisphosphatase [archaeon]
MITLEDYLTEIGCETSLGDLILLLSEQAEPIRDAFPENQDYAGTENASGEDQMALDVLADKLLTDTLEESGLVGAIGSEEKDTILYLNNPYDGFGVNMDPLDGSSLIDVNLAVGTIIGIQDKGNILNKGEDMLAAMYMIYGPMTTLVMTTGKGKGVHEFVLNNDGEFALLRENLRIPEDGKIYAPGALKQDYTDKHLEFIDNLEGDGYKLRYSGAFVADVHQILHKGGIFTYPATEKNENGKLRLLFEANPMGFMVTEAGGKISDGYRNILEIEPEAVHQRVPIYVGSKGPVNKIEQIMNR